MTTDVERQRKSRSEKYKAGLRQIVVWVREADKGLVRQLEAELHAKYNKEKGNESNVDDITADERRDPGK